MGGQDGRPFAVDRTLVEEAIGALRRAFIAQPDDDEADWLHVAAVATLVQVGMASDAVLRDGMRAAWVRLRHHPKDTVAASVIGFHVYRRDRLILPSWLSHRFRRRFTAAEVAREHELCLWTMLRADDAFFRALPPVEAVLERMASLEWRIEPTPGPAGDRILSLLGADIGHFLAGAEVYWMLDQMAHYSVLDWMNRHEPIRVRRFDFLNFPYCHFVGAK